MSYPERWEDQDRRSHERHAIRLDCEIAFGSRSARAKAVDLSFGGARVELPMPARVYAFDELVSLGFPGLGVFPVEYRWSKDHLVGLRFLAPERARPYLERLLSGAGAPGAIPPISG